MSSIHQTYPPSLTLWPNTHFSSPRQATAVLWGFLNPLLEELTIYSVYPHYDSHYTLHLFPSGRGHFPFISAILAPLPSMFLEGVFSCHPCRVFLLRCTQIPLVIVDFLRENLSVACQFWTTAAPASWVGGLVLSWHSALYVASYLPGQVCVSELIPSDPPWLPVMRFH